MKAHRHHSPKTAIILILTSVLSFAFVACDASKKCHESSLANLDKDTLEVCEKGCNDENAKFRNDACFKACNFGENLSACSKSCKLASYRDAEASVCRYPCEHGDTAACEKHEKCKKYFEALRQEIDAREKELRQEIDAREKEIEKEACHVTTWQLIGDVPNQSISNLSWRRNIPISIDEEAAIECAPTTGFIERFQTAVELGERPNPALLNRFSKELLKCGKAIGSNELVEVAKKCNGKWY